MASGTAQGRRVVVTGLGPVTPLGCGREAFWDAITAGRSATAPLATLPGGFPVASLRSRIAARVPMPEGGGADATAAVDDRRFHLAELAFRLALADAGLAAGDLDRAAVVLGNAVGAPLAVEQLFRRLRPAAAAGAAEASPASPADPAAHELLRQLSFHSLAHELAAAWGCAGRVLTVSTGCTAGLDAAGTAFELVRGGQATIAVTGAAEAPLTPIVFAAFDLIGALSRRNHDPEHASRPFDELRDGFVLAEGAAMLVLEERAHALRRGARIYAEIRGFASLSNSYHMTNLPPDGAALGRCIELALVDAGLEPQAVDHVNAHGSSTPQNDLCETNAVKAALGAHAYQVSVNSLKSMIGHALGASNAIELAACALWLDRQYLSPTINLDRPGPCCDLDYVANHGRAAALGHLLKLSSGFSGIHSAMVMSAAGAGL